MEKNLDGLSPEARKRSRFQSLEAAESSLDGALGMRQSAKPRPTEAEIQELMNWFLQHRSPAEVVPPRLAQIQEAILGHPHIHRALVDEVKRLRAEQDIDLVAIADEYVHTHRDRRVEIRDTIVPLDRQEEFRQIVGGIMEMMENEARSILARIEHEPYQVFRDRIIDGIRDDFLRRIVLERLDLVRPPLAHEPEAEAEPPVDALTTGEEAEILPSASEAEILPSASEAAPPPVKRTRRRRASAEAAPLAEVRNATQRRTTSGEEGVVCPYCGAPFKSAYQVNKHVRFIHSKEKPYACSYPGCEYRSADASNKNRHEMRVHQRKAVVATEARAEEAAAPPSFLRGDASVASESVPLAFESAEGSPRGSVEAAAGLPKRRSLRSPRGSVEAAAGVPKRRSLRSLRGSDQAAAEVPRRLSLWDRAAPEETFAAEDPFYVPAADNDHPEVRASQGLARLFAGIPRRQEDPAERQQREADLEEEALANEGDPRIEDVLERARKSALLRSELPGRQIEEEEDRAVGIDTSSSAEAFTPRYRMDAARHLSEQQRRKISLALDDIKPSLVEGLPRELDGMLEDFFLNHGMDTNSSSGVKFMQFSAEVNNKTREQFHQFLRKRKIEKAKRKLSKGEFNNLPDELDAILNEYLLGLPVVLTATGASVDVPAEIRRMSREQLFEFLRRRRSGGKRRTRKYGRLYPAVQKS